MNTLDILQYGHIVKAWLSANLGARVNFKSDAGATAVEYGIMVAFIAAVIIAAVVLLGGQINNCFNYVTDQIGSGGTSALACP